MRVRLVSFLKEHLSGQDDFVIDYLSDVLLNDTPTNVDQASATLEPYCPAEELTTVSGQLLKLLVPTDHDLASGSADSSHPAGDTVEEIASSFSAAISVTSQTNKEVEPKARRTKKKHRNSQNNKKEEINPTESLPSTAAIASTCIETGKASAVDDDYTGQVLSCLLIHTYSYSETDNPRE